jgi:hypothetical protein
MSLEPVKMIFPGDLERPLDWELAFAIHTLAK